MLNVPLVDISQIDTDEDAAAAAVSQIGDACRRNGFLRLSGHGVSPKIQEDILAMTRQFYALPAKKKSALDLTQSNKKRGYSGLGQQQLDPKGAPDSKESFYLSEDTRESGNQYPSEDDIPGFRLITSTYYDEMISLSQRIFRLLAIALGLCRDAFDHYSGADGTLEHTYGSTLRLVHYPPTEKLPTSGHDSQLSCGAHTDFGTLTLLLQDGVLGLQVQDLSTGEWCSVPSTKHVYVVNIGDLMQRWTNDAFKSAPHRVSMSDPVSRHSVPFFFNGNYGYVIRPILTAPDEGHKDKIGYEAITVGEHIKTRLLQTHIDLKTKVEL